MNRIGAIAFAGALGFASLAQAVPFKTFPVSGGVYNVDVLRQFDGSGNFTTLPTALNNVRVSGAGPATAIRAIDGGQNKLQWDGSGGSNDAGASGTFRVELDHQVWLKKFETFLNSSYLPQKYEIRVSQTGFASMTTVVPYAGIPAATQTDILTNAVRARYVEFNWLGTNANPYMQLREFRAYADATLSAPITTNEGYNLTWLDATGPVTATNLTPARWQDANAMGAVDHNFGTLMRGNNTGDAQLSVNLGSQYNLSAITMAFYEDQAWSGGTKVEGSIDGVTFPTSLVLFDSHASTGSYLSIPLAANPRIQFLRVTNYGGATGALSELEIFSIPEPATASACGLGVFALLGGRRTRRRERV